MVDLDHDLRQKIRKESDEIMFSRMEMNDRLKQKIRQQAGLDKKAKRRFIFPKSWVMGAAALAAAVWIIAELPLHQQPVDQTPVENPGVSLPPLNEGVGSGLSSLITTPLSTVEDAKTSFGSGLLIPTAVPEGFTLSEIAVVGVEGEPARDAIFTYMAGEKTITFVASRNPAAFPIDLFTKTHVGEADGYVFEQQGLTELFWMEEGIQYSVTGQITAEETISIAESMER